ncbi:hypothetical protein ACWDHW_27155 [Streptomyces melanosporofaciens]|uniref:hypothetical protein n=1 Tax=unclassified Streptomyces TaxID=2593676 RepID=UPI0036B84ED1
MAELPMARVLSPREGRRVRPRLTVLLGPDYSGKSSVLEGLAERGTCTVVSYDKALLDPVYSLIGRVRDEFLTEALRAPAGRYSSDLFLTVVQIAVVHLRDRMMDAPPDRPVIVDSYYFKLLAKCSLLGYDNASLFSWWRSFPPPDQVVYLDVEPAVAWERSGWGAHANPMEHYGEKPTEDSFTRFQMDLGEVMAKEMTGLNVITLGQPDGVEESVDLVEKTIRDGAHG